MKTSLFIPILVFIVLSCQSNKKIETDSKSKVIEVENKEALAENKIDTTYYKLDTRAMKRLWLGFTDPFVFSTKQYKDMGLNVFLEGEKPAKMQVIPINDYIIEIQHLLNWDKKTPIEKLIHYSKYTASCFIANGKDIKCMVSYQFENNKWKATGWGPLDKTCSAALSSIYFNSKDSLMNVCIVETHKGKTYINSNFITYNVNGKLVQIQTSGKKSSLTDHLKRFVDLAKSGKEGL